MAAASASADYKPKTVVVPSETIELLDVPRLRQSSCLASPLRERKWPDNKNFVSPGDYFIRVRWESDAKLDHTAPPERLGFLRAGPSEMLCWDPSKVRAAVVTCGGLACGLNVVIREVVMALWYQYGVRAIYGVQKGYRGFYSETEPPIPLEPRTVSHIHTEGGTVLGSSRGGFDADRIIGGIMSRGINMVFVIGGDGTHRGALALSKALKAKGVECAVAGVPKTIDKDIPLIDRTFGFETAIEHARHAITCAHTEATSARHGVGIVKLMGRHAGFIALWASLASRDVNCCLVPEVDFTIEALCLWLEERLTHRDHALIVIAEGCMPTDAAAFGVGGGSDGKEPERDASGNIKLGDVGEMVKGAIGGWFKEHHSGMEVNIKYIDPSYIIRSAPANASDSVLCAELAQAAVHGCMAGLTEFTVGTVDGEMAWLPIHEIATRKSKQVDPTGAEYARLVLSTGQPDLSGSRPGEAARALHTATSTAAGAEIATE